MARLKIPRRPGTFPGSRYSLARWFANSAQLSSIFRRRSHGGTAVLFIAERASLPFRPIIDPRDALDTQHTTSHSLLPLPPPLSLSLSLPPLSPLRPRYLRYYLKFYLLAGNETKNRKRGKRREKGGIPFASRFIADQATAWTEGRQRDRRKREMLALRSDSPSVPKGFLLVASA